METTVERGCHGVGETAANYGAAGNGQLRSPRSARRANQGPDPTARDHPRTPRSRGRTRRPASTAGSRRRECRGTGPCRSIRRGIPSGRRTRRSRAASASGTCRTSPPSASSKRKAIPTASPRSVTPISPRPRSSPSSASHRHTSHTSPSAPVISAWIVVNPSGCRPWTKAGFGTDSEVDSSLMPERSRARRLGIVSSIDWRPRRRSRSP